MTVKELKELLTEAPDDMQVYVLGDSSLGGFLFLGACEKESGIIEFGPPDLEQGETGQPGKGFVVMACGSTCTEEEAEEMGDKPEVLN